MYHHSILIIGTNTSEIRNKILEILAECGLANLTNPDVMELKGEDKSIGIDKVREAQNFLSKRPLISKKKLLLINEAQKLSLDAQNALLKTLEEPNDSSQIVLLVGKEDDVIGTIISRCQKVIVKDNFSPDKKMEELAEKFAASRVGERLALIEENKDIFTDKKEAIDFLDTLMYCLRKNLTKDNAKFINVALKVQSDLAATNINTRLAIEYLALN